MSRRTAAPKKGAEEDIFSVDLVGLKNSKALLSTLEKLHDGLKEISQVRTRVLIADQMNQSPSSQDAEDKLPSGLRSIAAQLVKADVLTNSDKVSAKQSRVSLATHSIELFICQDVRLTAACCLLDVLRIFAPEAPYNEAELQVFCPFLNDLSCF